MLKVTRMLLPGPLLSALPHPVTAPSISLLLLFQGTIRADLYFNWQLWQVTRWSEGLQWAQPYYATRPKAMPPMSPAPVPFHGHRLPLQLHYLLKQLVLKERFPTACSSVCQAWIWSCFLTRNTCSSVPPSSRRAHSFG